VPFILLYQSHHSDILEKLLKLRIGCAMGIRTDLLVTEEIAESSDLRATPFEFERAKRVEAALSILEGKWKIVVLNRLHILHVDTTFLIHNSFHPRKKVQEQRLPCN
jgi:hypothetical protein